MKTAAIGSMRKRYVLYVTVFLFAGLLGVLGLIFGLMPLFNERSTFSDYEKRSLASFPTLTVKNFFSGNYLDSVDRYVADHFPWREQWVELAFEVEQRRGMRSKDIGFFTGEIVLNPDIEGKENAQYDPEKQGNAAFADSLRVLEIDNEADSLTAEQQEVIADEKDVTRSHGMLIYNGMAIQLFGGTQSTAKHFIESANAYAEKLGDKVQIYALIVPIHAEFYLPDNYRKHSRSESQNISYIYSQLDERIKSVDAIAEMRPHKNQYLYFNTDHHWTGLGAYYAYRAFGKKAGIDYLPLDSLERKVIPNFLGSLYRITRDNRLKEKGDSVEYFKIPYATTAQAYTAGNFEKGRKCSLYSELYAKGANSYGVFLGADFPMMRIQNPAIQNGKKMLMLKNSYGNPLATYLPAHYEEVFVLDYRYFKGNVSQLVKEHGITDIMLFHVSSLANTASHSRLIKNIL
jgi:hypothetical protein